MERKPENNEFTGQRDMERAMREYMERLAESGDTRLNNMLEPRFVSCDFEKKLLTMAYPVRYWMLNPMDMMHGGAVAAALDFSMGVLSRYFSGEKLTPTLKFDMSFHHKVDLDDTLIVEAHVVTVGRTICNTECRAWAASAPQKLCSSATAMYFVGYEKRG